MPGKTDFSSGLALQVMWCPRCLTFGQGFLNHLWLLPNSCLCPDSQGAWDISHSGKD